MELVNKVLTYWYSYFPPTWPDQDWLQFLVLLMMGAVTPKTYSDFAVNKYQHTVARSQHFCQCDFLFMRNKGLNV